MNKLILSKEPKRKAAFITEDGSFINLEDNKVTLIGYSSREVVHPDFINYLNNEHVDVNTLNLIRVNDGTYLYINEEAYIELNKKEPTPKQYEALLKYLDFLMLTSKKKYLVININNTILKYEFINKSNKNGLLPEDIIKQIFNNYKN